MPLPVSTNELTKSSAFFSHTTRAFKHKNYRLFFAGQFVSLIGTWITSIATSWLAFRLTNSELALGLVSFAGQFPSFLLAPLAGVLVDRWNRQHVLFGTQFASMLQSAALAYFTLSGEISLPLLCVLSVFQALINAFDMPGRQSFLNEIIEEKSDLPNAIALNSAMFNGARLIGPAIGGLIIAVSSEGVCFAVDAVSYLAVLFSLFQIKVKLSPAKSSQQKVLEGLKEGARYSFGSVSIREILITISLISLLGTPHIVLMPVFAHDILHGGPKLLGVLMGASGLGAVLGALSLASRDSIRGLGRVIGGCGFVLGSALLLFAYCKLVWLSSLLLFLSGASMITLLASCNTILQTISDPEKRGRVMSFYMMSFMGMMPIGSLLAGAIAARFGAPLTVFGGGLFCLCVALRFLKKLPQVREELRPIYRRLGIIPETDSAQSK